MNTPIFDIETLDFNHLRRSKMLLLTLHESVLLDSDQKEDLMGLVHMIDAIQDDLVDNRGYDENKIYLFTPETEE